MLIICSTSSSCAFLPTAPYFKYSDSRISTVCYDWYSSTLAMLEETADETFKAYMTRKTQGWFRRWGCDAAAASPGPSAAPDGTGSGGGAGAATPARLPAPDASDDEEGSALITPAGPGGGAAAIMCHRQLWTWERRCQTGAGRRRRRRTPSKTSRLQPGDPHHGGR